ncbi:transaldolase family protein [Domibacillus sp. DTU_2020_1001157_1_SI_ALB_TIR_016]|uniref:transaldolase family protein n=1 Tax=Domibacillus sp. DTU_2020_1001157_1_SI_ALB_TIR_016 TaxID=3077789 RepID=UPI0028ED6BBC|nr:transaldolase family protein [Domibacillus sp. DTU_2020_1001157_1_SI_ALB_TIR_016]WNS78275.1 transaldolase family protein [Domibacillus sp. DTU_2020_1001157_1_SI_ALB_TIR_016]
MLLVIDSANIESIQDLAECFPVDGVTTNPAIITKEKKPFLPLLKEIQSIIGKERMLFVQVLQEYAEEMVKEAVYLKEEIGGNLYIKIPVTAEGIKAIKQLKQQGIRTLATAIYTPMQALVAAKAGADFVAPYVNRIDNLAGDGVQVVRDIVEAFDRCQLPCQVLAASFKNTQQVHGVGLAGVHGVTAGPKILKSLVEHPVTESNVKQFVEDWKLFYGEACDSVIHTQ